MAEREGFEPSRRYHRLHTFQACAFNHSATSPDIVPVAGKQAGTARTIVKTDAGSTRI